MIIKIITAKRRQGLAGVWVLALACAAVACTGRAPRPDAGEEQLPDGGKPLSRSLLVAEAAACAMAGAKDFRDAAQALKERAEAWKATGADEQKREVEQAFHQAMDLWQRNEAMQFGPAAPSTTTGGEDMGAQIDSWPLHSRCGIEEHLVAQSYQAGVGHLLVNRRGLPALEYLLFYEGAQTACPETSPIVATGSWAALSAGERAERRRAYAAAVASDLAGWASLLVQRWEGGFMQSMTTAGAGNTLFASPQSALNVVSDALLYVDVTVLNRKLAPPLGLRDCAAPPCLDLLESPYASRSKRNIAQNIEGLRRLALGCSSGHSGLGFDDLLAGVGADGAATRLRERVDALQVALDGVTQPDLKEALVVEPAAVRSFYDTTRALSAFLKTELLTILDLELPKTLEGDND